MSRIGPIARKVIGMSASTRRILFIAPIVAVLCYPGYLLYSWWVISRSMNEIEAAGGRVTPSDVMAGPGFGSARVYHVDFSGAKLTDEKLAAAVPPLKHLGRIRFLNLRGTQVGDLGLKSLEGLPIVDLVDVSKTRVTANGIADLRKRFPLLNVVDNSGPRSFDHRGCRSLLFGPDGRMLAVVGESATEIWNTDTGDRTATAPGGNAAAFSTDGKRLAVACVGEVVVWNLETDREQRKLPNRTQSPYSVAFREDGRYLFVDEFVETHQYEAESGKYLASSPRFLLGGGGNHGGLNLDKRVAAMTHPDRGELAGKLPGIPGQVRLGVVAADGTRAAWMPDPAINPVASPTLHIVNLQIGEDVRQIKLPRHLLLSGAFDRRAARLAVGGMEFGRSDGTLLVYDVATGKELFSHSDPAGTTIQIALSDDGRKVAAAFSCGSVRWWELKEVLRVL
jgi:WD40 repeat protein